MPATSTISVITVTRNDKVNMERTIESLTSQTLRGYEYIVIDGASTDGSVDILSKHSRVNAWISEKDNGIYDAMNKGIRMAKGDYLFFLNAGDVFYDSTVLSDVAEALKNRNYPHILFGNVALTKGDGREVIQRRDKCDVTDIFFKPINHQSIFAARDTLKEKFSTEFRVLADYHWFLGQLVKKGTKIAYMDRTFSLYDVKGFSGSNKQLLQLELKRVRELYFRKGYVLLLSGMKGTRLMYLTRMKALRSILNKSILKFRLDREEVANV